MLVIRVLAPGALVAVIVLCFLVSDERQPHIELAPAQAALGLPPAPAASGAMPAADGAVISLD